LDRIDPKGTRARTEKLVQGRYASGMSADEVLLDPHAMWRVLVDALVSP